MFRRNQENSKLSIWENNTNKSSDSEHLWSLENLPMGQIIEEPYQLLYDIDTYQEYWEPVIVMPMGAPSFEERFIGYGNTRNSLV